MLNLPWGPLGQPNKEQIQAFKDMPHGKFKAMIKGAKSKKTAAAPEYPYKIKVTKRITRTDLHEAWVAVNAKDSKQAISLAELYKPGSLEFKPGFQNLEKTTYEYQAFAGGRDPVPT